MTAARTAWRPLARLAWRDARRHAVRTITAVLLIALPIAAICIFFARSASTVPARETALAGIPDGAQAVITTTAVTRSNPPFAQLPEGAPGTWIDDLEQVPATQDELAGILGDDTELLPYWDSPDLIATTSLGLAPGEQAAAGEGVLPDALSGISAATVREASDDAFAMLAPPADAGALPADADEVLVTSALADRLSLSVGDTVAFVAAPFNGWYSSDGRIGEVIQNTQRAYRVSGISDGDGLQAWTRAGWMSRLVEADSAGVDGHWLAVGPNPVTWDQAKHLNALQAFAVSRDVLTHYPDASELYPVEIDVQAYLEQLVLLVLGGALSAVLALSFITPAFAVSVDQSRRALGLQAAIGAGPRELRRTVGLQGLSIGIIGAVLGSLAGMAGWWLVGIVQPAGGVSLSRYPWWTIPAAIAGGAVIGLVATRAPARTAARLEPVAAMRDLAPSRSGSRSRPAGLLIALIGPALLLIAVACGVWLILLPEPDIAADDNGVVPPLPPGLIALLVMVVLTAVIGLLLCVRTATAVAARLAARAGAVLRLALRDAAEHRSRFVPAATAVLFSVCAASFSCILIGSGVANDRSTGNVIVAAGHIAIAPTVAISGEFDRLVLADAISSVDVDGVTVTGSEPVYSSPSRQKPYLSVMLPDGACPDDRYPSPRSALDPAAPRECVEYERSFSMTMRIPWWAQGDDLVLTGDALRATGLPGADAAARVLDAGGVVVPNAAEISDEATVRIGGSMSGTSPAEEIAELPGAFLRGLAGSFAISPETARTLGSDPQYVGELITTEPAVLLPAQVSAVIDEIQARTSLVQVQQPPSPYPWGGAAALVPVAALAAIACAAIALTLALARTQTRRDFTTMHAVGAPPGFLRRFAIAQTGVVLATGIPLGLASGFGLGALVVSWNRKIGASGPWLDLEPLWGVQLAVVAAIVVVGLACSLALSRPPQALTRRPLD